MKVAKLFEIATGHRLSNYDGKCKNLHGHNYIGEVIIEADELDNLGMIIDFGELKRVLNDTIVKKFDHKFVAKKDDPFNQALWRTCQEYNDDSIVFVDYNPTVEALIADMQKMIKDYIPQDVKVSIKCSETSTSYAEISSDETSS